MLPASTFIWRKNYIGSRRSLQTQTYRPGEYREFYVYEPKTPQKLVLPPIGIELCITPSAMSLNRFLNGHSSMILMPAGKAKGRIKPLIGSPSFSRKNAYVLKCDIKKYFPSIDHEILKTRFRRKIRDAQVLWLLDLIVDSSNPQEYVHEYFEGDDLLTSLNRRRGIPIGNLTSQFFREFYLNGFDHFIKEDLKCRYYIRYVDDFVVLEKDKARLHQVKAEMETYLARFRLKLHPDK